MTQDEMVGWHHRLDGWALCVRHSVAAGDTNSAGTVRSESEMYCKDIQPVHPKGDQSWVFIGRNDATAETPVLWPLHVPKS